MLFLSNRKDTPAAKIFNSMTCEDFQHTNVVTKTAKRLAWFLVIILNLYFVYFSVLRGITRSVSWQREYVLACIFQLLVEVFLYETVECLWIHYTIPKLVSGEVAVAMKTVRHTVSMAFKNEHDLFCLDSPKYFFVSRQLADAFPQLFESSVVRAFHNHFPPSNLDLQISPIEYRNKKKERKKVFPCTEWDLEDEVLVKEPQKKRSRLMNFFRRFNASALAFLLLQAIGTVPIRFQQLAIHTIQPILFSFVIILFLIIEEHPVIALIPMAIVAYEAIVYANKDHAEDKNPVAAINDTEKIDNIRRILKEKQEGLSNRSNDTSYKSSVARPKNVGNDNENRDLTAFVEASDTDVYNAMDTRSSGIRRGYTRQQTLEEFIQEMAEPEDIDSSPTTEKNDDNSSNSRPDKNLFGIKRQLTTDELIREMADMDEELDVPKVNYASDSDVDGLPTGDIDSKLLHLEGDVSKLERNVRRMCVNACFMTYDDFLVEGNNGKVDVNSSHASTAFACGCQKANPFADHRSKWQLWWDDYRLFESDLILPYRNNSGYKVPISEIENVRALINRKPSKMIPKKLAHEMTLLQQAEHNQFVYTEQLLQRNRGIDLLAKHSRAVTRLEGE